MKIFLFKLLIFSVFFTGCSSLQRVDPKEKISKNFTMKEAVKEGNKISKEIKKNIVFTAKRLEEFREYLDEPLHIASWYRTPEENQSGSKTSAHLQGLAVDFRVKSSSYSAYEKIISSGKSFDQIIYYKNLNMIHLGFKADKSLERNQILPSK